VIFLAKLTMSDELFDIVTEHNVPTGEVKPRDLVHRDLQDWHRATHVWIVNHRCEVLCQQRSMNKDSNPGMWQSFFGGHLKSGEGYESNALSELKEEIGLVAAANALIPIYVKKSDKAKHFGQVYVLMWDGDVSTLTFQDGEVQQIAWIPLHELKQMIEAGKFCNSYDSQVANYINTMFT
jgi:16S rRNA (adenine1518-N6/adenine1519-N6)-dimethyltransferase